MKFYFYSLIFLLIDQISKYLITLKLKPNQLMEINNYLNIVYFKNTGFIFGFFSDIPYLYYLIINLFLFIIIIYLLLKIFYENKAFLFPVSLIIGGGISNLFDRIFKNGVIDFIDFYYKELHWPAFNFADVFITSGIIIFILINIVEKRNCLRA